MADKQSTKPPAGTRDFLPDDIRRREYVIREIRDVYTKYGFEPLETPAFENIETLLGKYGEEGNKLIFKILRRGEHEHTGQADLALRYDLTVPLARVVAQYQNQIPKFFKRYQIQPVWRADRPAKGRFREFYQCDLDSIGSTSPVVEADIISAVSEILIALGFDDFVFRLNHRELLQSMLRHWLVPVEYHSTVLIALDKLDKIGSEGVLKEISERSVPAECVTRVRNWLGAAFPTDWLAWLQRDIQAFDETGKLAFANLQEIVAIVPAFAKARIRVDLTLARGLSYYTGAIMEVAVPDIAGSLGGGGRYDNLIGMFLGNQVPACGFSIGLERILVVMTERNMFPKELGRPVDILVTIWSQSARADALQLAVVLREAGLRVEVYPEADKLVKQFRYADTRGVPLVAVVGDDERAAGSVTIKDMILGGQQPVPRESVADYVRNLSGSRTENREP